MGEVSGMWKAAELYTASLAHTQGGTPARGASNPGKLLKNDGNLPSWVATPRLPARLGVVYGGRKRLSAV
jgi:hypothetical protein